MVSIKSLLSLITFFKINQKVISWISFIGSQRIPLIGYKLSLALNAVEKKSSCRRFQTMLSKSQFIFRVSFSNADQFANTLLDHKTHLILICLAIYY